MKNKRMIVTALATVLVLAFTTGLAYAWGTRHGTGQVGGQVASTSVQAQAHQGNGPNGHHSSHQHGRHFGADHRWGGTRHDGFGQHQGHMWLGGSQWMGAARSYSHQSYQGGGHNGGHQWGNQQWGSQSSGGNQHWGNQSNGGNGNGCCGGGWGW